MVGFLGLNDDVQRATEIIFFQGPAMFIALSLAFEDVGGLLHTCREREFPS